METHPDPATRAAAVAAARGPRWRRVLRALASVLGGLAALLLVTIVLAVVVVPRALGGTTLTVLTGSMEPTIAPGDVLAVTDVHADTACDTIRIGNVISFLPYPDDPTLISHRVIAKGSAPRDWEARGYGGPCTFTTQGDANSAPDDKVLPAQVRGVVRYVIPQLGWARQLVGSQPDTVTWVVLGAVLLFGLVSWLRPRRRIIQVTIPPDPRVSAAGAVVEAWRALPRDQDALEDALANLAETFADSAATPDDTAATPQPEAPDPEPAGPPERAGDDDA